MPLTKADFTDPFEPIYTFVDGRTGENVHIASTRLRAWCIEHRAELEVQAIPVDKKLAASFQEKNAILPKRVHTLLAKLPEDMEQWEPIIYAHDGSFGSNGGPNVMLVDGHHRYFAAALIGAPFILGWFLTVPQWEPFKIEGLREYSEQELVDEPIISKPHWGGPEGTLEIHLRAGADLAVLEKLFRGEKK